MRADTATTMNSCSRSCPPIYTMLVIYVSFGAAVAEVWALFRAKFVCSEHTKGEWHSLLWLFAMAGRVEAVRRLVGGVRGAAVASRHALSGVCPLHALYCSNGGVSRGERVSLGWPQALLRLSIGCTRDLSVPALCCDESASFCARISARARSGIVSTCQLSSSLPSFLWRGASQ